MGRKKKNKAEDLLDIVSSDSSLGKKWKETCDCCNKPKYGVHGYWNKERLTFDLLCPECARELGYAPWIKYETDETRAWEKEQQELFLIKHGYYDLKRNKDKKPTLKKNRYEYQGKMYNITGLAKLFNYNKEQKDRLYKLCVQKRYTVYKAKELI